MNIVFGDDVAEELRKKYTLLEVDTVQHPEHGLVSAWVVLPMESIAMEMASLDQNVMQHAMLIESLKKDDASTVRLMCQALTGKFGGEMDTFYEEITKRIDNTGSTLLPNS
jgi:hypothetical protein